MSVSEVVAKYPQTIKIFFRHGLQCTGCYICCFHSIAEGAEQYDVELGLILNDLNDAIIEKDP
ncbi:MAG: DUF1858 domain-containing protein [Anaerolineales bacterium]|nr:DUF1858 domain-containing protein [Anaerolineales bacterium]